jgi:hypothetical protein
MNVPSQQQEQQGLPSLPCPGTCQYWPVLNIQPSTSSASLLPLAAAALKHLSASSLLLRHPSPSKNW